MIDPRFIVSLKGKDFPTWAGVLDAATKAGLRSLTTDLEQLMELEKGGYFAVVKARAEFEDGRVFEDYGDAAPFNTSPQIATAAIRMASTRAKGRVLRDALNVGMTLLEELPDDEEAPAARSGRGAKARVDEASPTPEDELGKTACQWPDCGALLTLDEIKGSVRAFGERRYCTEHGKSIKQAEAVK